MSGIVTILTFLMLMATLCMLAVAFVSALNVVQIGGWRLLLSGPIGWLHPPPRLDPALWRHRRRCLMCVLVAIACLQAHTLILRSMM